MSHRLSKYPSRRSYIEDTEVNQFKVEGEEDGPQGMLTMRDQDQMVQELKKENFDLKLRLYMTQKSSDTNEGKVSEYEQQLVAILNRFEEQQTIFEQQSQHLAEARQKERHLLKKQRNLESECKQKDEKIQNLSMNLSRLSTSMVNLSSPRSVTHSRGGINSMYFPDADDDEATADEYDSEHQLNSAQVSRVAPMRRDNVSTSSYQDDVLLMENTTDGHPQNSYDSPSSGPTTKNIYNTTINNPQSRTDASDNIVRVKPNNSRTIVDVKVPESRDQSPQPKKKNKRFFNVFKLCSGKSGQTMSRGESIYHKKPAHVARVTMETYNNNAE